MSSMIRIQWSLNASNSLFFHFSPRIVALHNDDFLFKVVLFVWQIKFINIYYSLNTIVNILYGIIIDFETENTHRHTKTYTVTHNTIYIYIIICNSRLILVTLNKTVYNSTLTVNLFIFKASLSGWGPSELLYIL